METAIRYTLVLSVSILAIVAAVALFKWLEAFSYEAYVPRYIEVPVEIRKTPPVTVASSSLNSSDPENPVALPPLK